MELLTRVHHLRQPNIERIAARVFVVCSFPIWIAAAVVSEFEFHFGGGILGPETSVTQMLGGPVGAMIPLAAATVALLVGWFYERLAALLLLGFAGLVVIWGALSSWSFAPWAIAISVLLAPAIFAGVLFWAAARMQTILETADREKPKTPVDLDAVKALLDRVSKGELSQTEAEAELEQLPFAQEDMSQHDVKKFL
jgi:hypothetical protein